MRNCEEVEILLKQINTNNTQLAACIQICRHSYSANFNEAVTYLSTQIAQIFPDSQPGYHTRRGHGQTNICCRNVAKAQTRNDKKPFNGVNINLIESYFSAKEWAQLGPHRQKILNDCPKRKAKKEALMSRKKRKISSVSIQNSNQKDLLAQQRTLAEAVINGVMQASIPVTDDDTLLSRYSASARARMPQIGTHATRNTSAVSTCYHPTYDHHVKIVNEELATVLFRILFFLCVIVLYYHFVFAL